MNVKKAGLYRTEARVSLTCDEVGAENRCLS